MANSVTLREVIDGDLGLFYEHQADPEAHRMAAFPPRDKDAFDAHWAKTRANKTGVIKTILWEGNVAGYIGSWEQSGERKVGYWIGKEYWGKGIASAALSQFVDQNPFRPLTASVVKSNLASIRVLQKCGFIVTGEAKFDEPDGNDGEELIMTLPMNAPDSPGSPTSWNY
jgi:RimJ/RimL family protein N-acetyltransferase